MMSPFTLKHLIMGRRRNRRNRNKAKNRSNRSNTFSGAVTMTYLKSDGDVGLFMDTDGTKYRVHKKGIYGTIGWMHKGANIAVKESYAHKVKTQRIIVDNVADLLGGNEEKEKHIYERDTHVISSAFTVAQFGLPIGTQYYYIAFGEFPNVGDYVMTSLGSSTTKSRVSGFVEAVNKENYTAVIEGIEVSIYDIGYHVINPEILLSNKEIANA